MRVETVLLHGEYVLTDDDSWLIKYEGIQDNDQSLGMILDGIEMFGQITLKHGDKIKITIESEEK